MCINAVWSCTYRSCLTIQTLQLQAAWWDLIIGVGRFCIMGGGGQGWEHWLGGGARLRILVGGKGEPNFSQDVNWSKSSPPPPTTSRLQSVPNNDISHNKTDHIAKLRIELKSILLAKSLNWYICDLVFTVSRRHWRKMWVDCWGGEDGA